MLKKRKALIVLMAVSMLLTLSAQAAQKETIVAVVNDEVITSHELEEAFAPVLARIEAGYKGSNKEKVVSDTKKALLKRLIDGILIEQEAKKTGIVIKDEEVAETINNMLTTRKMTKDDLLKALEKDGVTLDAYTKDMKTQMVRMRLVRREINSRVMVTDDEIGAFYREHRDLYEGKEAVRIKQILLSFPPNCDAACKARLKASAEDIVAKIKSGESFETLAAQSSQGPAAATGGDLGFIERGVILPEVEEAAFRLAIDQVSPVIESPVGCHIVKVTDKRGAGAKSMESLRAEIREKILEEKAEKRYEGWILELRAKSHVEIRI